MKRGANVVQVCPGCGTRIVPTAREIKELRTAAGLTQTEFARMLKVQASYIAYLENGRRNPSAVLIRRYRALERKLAARIADRARSLSAKAEAMAS